MKHSSSDARVEIYRPLVMCPYIECKGLVGRVMNECLGHLRENERYEELQIDPRIVQHV